MLILYLIIHILALTNEIIFAEQRYTWIVYGLASLSVALAAHPDWRRRLTGVVGWTHHRSCDDITVQSQVNTNANCLDEMIFFGLL